MLIQAMYFLLIHFSSGITYGMVELIRRVIPADIVGGHIGKLKRMDSMVHGKLPRSVPFQHAQGLRSFLRSNGHHWSRKCPPLW